jgi:hypothetical protein
VTQDVIVLLAASGLRARFSWGCCYSLGFSETDGVRSTPTILVGKSGNVAQPSPSPRRRTARRSLAIDKVLS